MFVVKRQLTIFKDSTLHINRTDEYIEYVVNRTYIDQNGKKFSFNFVNKTFPLSEFTDRADFTDYAQYGIYMKEENLANLTAATELFDMATHHKWDAVDLKSKIDELYGANYSNHTLGVIHIVNMAALTLPTKTNLSGLRNVVSGTRLMHLFFPLTTTKLSKVPFVVAAYPGMEVRSVEPIIPSESDSIMTNSIIQEWITNNCTVPVIKIVGPISIVKDKHAVLEVSVTNRKDGSIITDPIELYVEHVNGYVPYSRITTVDGKCTIPVSAMLMTPGDTIKVKVGFKFYTSLADHELEVVKK